MDRRGFISTLFKASAAATATAIAAPQVAIAAAKIWIPTNQIATEPSELTIVKNIIAPGERIFGLFIGSDYINELSLIDIYKDVIRCFPGNVPILILSRKPEEFSRFMFVGSKESLLRSERAKVIGGFENSVAFIDMARRNTN